MLSHSIYQVFHRILRARPAHTYSVTFRPQGEDERIPTKVLWTLVQTRHTGVRIEQLDPGLEFHRGLPGRSRNLSGCCTALNIESVLSGPLGRTFGLA